MKLKQVKVQFVSAGAELEDTSYREDGFANENGLVMAVDAWGSVSIYKIINLTNTFAIVESDSLLVSYPKLFIDFMQNINGGPSADNLTEVYGKQFRKQFATTKRGNLK